MIHFLNLAIAHLEAARHAWLRGQPTRCVAEILEAAKACKEAERRAVEGAAS